MTQKIYNTLSQKMEALEAMTPGRINFFVCGPTVYDMPHLGHAKTYVQFDMIARYLRSRGYEVFYLQNITDIDDKIIARAAEQGMGWDALAQKFEKVYLEDMASLHVTSVTKYIRSTDYIEEVVSQVERLMEQGFAYRTSDGIYFEIAKFAEYGKLSHRSEVGKDDAVSRIDAGAEKRGWNDFCLWKNSKEGEPSWDTRIDARHRVIFPDLAPVGQFPILRELRDLEIDPITRTVCKSLFHESLHLRYHLLDIVRRADVLRHTRHMERCHIF
jgi:cysteinyl-tRNA synthetase